jgi:hypothetical protein
VRRPSRSVASTISPVNRFRYSRPPVSGRQEHGVLAPHGRSHRHAAPGQAGALGCAETRQPLCHA